MNKTMLELYTLVNDRICITPVHQEKIHALALAKMAILNEMEQQAEKDIVALLDAYTSIDGERQEMHTQMVFEAALELGMELGRLGG